MNAIALVRTTCASEDDAAELARALVEERLAACVTVEPGARSTYRWEGLIQSDPEVVLLAKTTPARAGALIDRLEALHRYDLPVIETWHAEVSAAVGTWVAEEVEVLR